MQTKKILAVLWLFILTAFSTQIVAISLTRGSVIPLTNNEVGYMCYHTSSPGSTQDDTYEVMFVTQPYPGVYDSAGISIDLDGKRTTIHGTSVYANGVITRTSYGTLGDVQGEITDAYFSDPRSIYYRQARMNVYISHATLIPTPPSVPPISNEFLPLKGTFMADVYFHGPTQINVFMALNKVEKLGYTKPGTIEQIPCSDVPF